MFKLPSFGEMKFNSKVRTSNGAPLLSHVRAFGLSANFGEVKMGKMFKVT